MYSDFSIDLLSALVLEDKNKFNRILAEDPDPQLHLDTDEDMYRTLHTWCYSGANSNVFALIEWLTEAGYEAPEYLTMEWILTGTAGVPRKH